MKIKTARDLRWVGWGFGRDFQLVFILRILMENGLMR